ncbi:hypothetical protein [Fodinicola acaciae]|uniref:hypothetical protein n=1 Tax=Fodinicola acaciae TaxID=2681555 RepID=UPI0013D8C54F|nr:hypothetical protein [Fodinicola acaciae]
MSAWLGQKEVAVRFLVNVVMTAMTVVIDAPTTALDTRYGRDKSHNFQRSRL